MNWKKTITFSLILGVMSSCKITDYRGSVGQVVTTKIQLSEANFEVLGSFTGTASAKKALLGIKNKTGIISDAKKNLIENAKKAGVELKGARVLINIVTDIVENSTRITCTMAAEIIEFKK